MASKLIHDPDETRTHWLLLGGFELALVALVAVVMATSESPAPPVTAAGAGHRAGGAGSARGGSAAGQDVSGGEAGLVDVQGALIAEKNAVVRELIAAVTEYARLRDAIYKAHPGLEEVPGLLKGLERWMMEDFQQGVKECQALAQQSPEMRDRLHELMVLKRADVMLEALNHSDPSDPTFDAMFERAGFKQQVVKDLTVMDRVAGYEGDTQGAAASLAAFRAAYEARVPVYAAAAAAKQAQWGLQVTEAMDGALMASAFVVVQKPMLQLYHDSFFGEAEAAMAQRVGELQRQLMDFPAAIEADAGPCFSTLSRPVGWSQGRPRVRLKSAALP